MITAKELRGRSNKTILDSIEVAVSVLKDQRWDFLLGLTFAEHKRVKSIIKQLLEIL